MWPCWRCAVVPRLSHDQACAGTGCWGILAHAAGLPSGWPLPLLQVPCPSKSASPFQRTTRRRASGSLRKGLCISSRSTCSEAPSCAGPSLHGEKTAAGPSSSSAGTSAGQSQPPQQLGQPGERSTASAPLGAVVSDAVRRWYLEASKEAAKGDVVRCHSLAVTAWPLLATPVAACNVSW